MKKLFILSGLCLFTLQGFSQASFLDSTFSNDGLVYDLYNQHSWGTDVAVQADGKVLGTIQRDDMFRVYRLNVDGSWDNSFDGDGMFEYDAAFLGTEECNSLTIQPDGKILVAGTASYTGSGMDVVVLRINTDGTLDNTFGSGGVAVANAGGILNDYGRRIVLKSNGKILIGGTGGAGQTSDKQMLMQFKANGTLDSAFGTNGIVLNDYQGSLTNLVDLSLQPDGKIVTCGSVYFNNNAEVMVARYDSLGNLDMSFDGDGWLIYGFGNSMQEFGKRVIVQSTGKILVCSRSYGQMNRMYFNRYNSDGTADNSFGTAGASFYDYTTVGNTTELTEAILMPNDDILVAGSAFTGIGEFNYGILKLNGSDGSVQTGFASNGTITTDFLGFYDFIYGLAIAPDGKIVAAGATRTVSTSTYSYPSVARYKLISTAVTEVSNEVSLGIYPNPSNGSLTISGDKAATLAIVNTLGQVVKTVELSASNNYTAKVEGLPKGIFYVQASNGVVKNKIVSL
jgi:uncharacterized delta-60 repeat protein